MRKRVAMVLAPLAGLMAEGCVAVVPVQVSEREVSYSCDAAGLQDLVGQPATENMATDALKQAKARVLRWIPPNAAVTMDYRPDRLNISLDAEGRVVDVKCG